MLIFWADLKSSDFAHLDPETTVVVLPLGAVEQHGPHLPLGVDSFINEAIVHGLKGELPAELTAIVMPTCWVGRSEEHRQFAGSLSFSASTLRAMWFELGQSVARCGLRKMIMFNSHGGQIQVMQIVARELRVRHAMFVVSVSWPQLGLPDQLIDPLESRHGIHAGEVETSMMLQLKPELVDMDKAGDFRPLSLTQKDRFPILHSLGPAGFGWMAQDLHASGACGNALVATADKGKRLLEHGSRRFGQLIHEVAGFPLSTIDDAGIETL